MDTTWKALTLAPQWDKFGRFLRRLWHIINTTLRQVWGCFDKSGRQLWKNFRTTLRKFGTTKWLLSDYCRSVPLPCGRGQHKAIVFCLLKTFWLLGKHVATIWWHVVYRGQGENIRPWGGRDLYLAFWIAFWNHCLGIPHMLPFLSSSAWKFRFRVLAPGISPKIDMYRIPEFDFKNAVQKRSLIYFNDNYK